MGYYTDFELTADKELPDTFKEVFKEVTGYSIDDDFSLCSVKWYNFPKDMKQLSLKYPNVAFQLDGNGEESGDVWRMYFKNGKMQSANTKVTVVHEDFDESKLK